MGSRRKEQGIIINLTEENKGHGNKARRIIEAR